MMELHSENTQLGFAMKIRQRKKVGRGKLDPIAILLSTIPISLCSLLGLWLTATVDKASALFSGRLIQPAKRLQRSSSDLMLVMCNFGQAVSPLCASVSSSVQWREEWYLFHKILRKSQWAHTHGMTGLWLVHTGAQQVSPSSGSQ